MKSVLLCLLLLFSDRYSSSAFACGNEVIQAGESVRIFKKGGQVAILVDEGTDLADRLHAQGRVRTSGYS